MQEYVTDQSHHVASLPTGIAADETVLTFACWARAANITAVHRLMCITDFDTISNRHELQMSGNVANDPCRMFSNDGTTVGAATTDPSPGAYSANTLHHVAGVVNGASSRQIYLDGAAGTENTSTISPTSMDVFSVGSIQDSTPSYTPDTQIAEAAVWDVALTAAEISILAARYSPLFVRPGRLVFYMPAVRNVYDYIGGLTITADNSPTVVVHPPMIYPSPPQIITAPAAVGGLSIPVAMNQYFRQHSNPGFN